MALVALGASSSPWPPAASPRRARRSPAARSAPSPPACSRPRRPPPPARPIAALWPASAPCGYAVATPRLLHTRRGAGGGGARRRADHLVRALARCPCAPSPSPSPPSSWPCPCWSPPTIRWRTRSTARRPISGGRHHFASHSREAAELRRVVDEDRPRRRDRAPRSTRTWAALLRPDRGAPPPLARSPGVPRSRARSPTPAPRPPTWWSGSASTIASAITSRCWRGPSPPPAQPSAAAVSLDDAALRGTETAGESLEEVSRAIVDQA